MVHQKIDHQFSDSRFEWDSKENLQPCIKLSFFFKKLPNVDDDHFQMHYNHVHADLTVASKQFDVVKIQRYVQTYQTPEMKEKIKSLGMEVLDYDACSQIWVKDWDAWERFSTSPEYAAALLPDADHFMDYKTSGIKCFAGHDMIAFGKAIPDCDVKDGITRGNKSLARDSGNFST
ncbi:hypothetical protein BU24DRAFT_464626 [Aaosphaeria arxii CBS 175.79]|uniref:EthD domain-containing protein n=1 Tax=Aaosphaeria arxii CBS 175.79 TaxID=1450172 RepID=A0A6A5XMD0_9PLEO|nr:uncharacterized protein BU24DRAFT_464626 [Aaosphaeria arxii CBS 175.79]KAF2013900.1 hypothetical protein BU24DRAFT_464626 [Aaosphaeria arxii CBS 175.79]